MTTSASKSMMTALHKTRHFTKRISNRVWVSVGVLLFAGVGTTLLLSSHAATPTASFQVENGTLSGNATTVADSSASNGRAIKFNITGSGSSCPVSTSNKPDGPDGMGGCWPGPATTGYPHGLPGDTRTPVTLTAYTGPTNITSCGIVIDSKTVNADITLQVGNGTHTKDTPCLTIRNSLIRGVVFGTQGTSGPIVIQDSEVWPPDLPFWENIGRSNVFAYRVNSHGGEGVIKCDNYCEAKDDYVHGMRLGEGYHYNAFGGNGTDQFNIEHNWASCGDWESAEDPVPAGTGCSADIGFYGDFGLIQNVTINKNFFAGLDDALARDAGPGYCLNTGYAPGKAYPVPYNMTITNNVFGRGSTGKCGAYGPTISLNPTGQTNGNTWSNNKYEDGVVIPWPQD